MAAFVGIFGRFYTGNRPVLVRLAAAASADPDLAQAVRARNALRRLAIEPARPPATAKRGTKAAPRRKRS